MRYTVHDKENETPHEIDNAYDHEDAAEQYVFDAYGEDYACTRAITAIVTDEAGDTREVRVSADLTVKWTSETIPKKETK